MEQPSGLYRAEEGQHMKLGTIVLATALTFTSTLALAQSNGTGGYGSVVQPSVGSYSTAVGSTNVVPTWRNTGPAAPLPSSPTFAPIPVPAPTVRTSGVRR
jgi:hypothetical protein